MVYNSIAYSSVLNKIHFVRQSTNLVLHHHFEQKSEKTFTAHWFLILSRKEFVNIMPAAFQRKIHRREHRIRVLEK